MFSWEEDSRLKEDPRYERCTGNVLLKGSGIIHRGETRHLPGIF